MARGHRVEVFDQRPGAVDKILGAANEVANSAAAIAEIRALVDQVAHHAVLPSRRIRQILKAHGL